MSTRSGSTLPALLASTLAVDAVAKPWPPAPPDVARLDVEEVYQFYEGSRPDPLFDGYVIGPGEDRPQIIIVVPVDAKAGDDGS